MGLGFSNQRCNQQADLVTDSLWPHFPLLPLSHVHLIPVVCGEGDGAKWLSGRKRAPCDARRDHSGSRSHCFRGIRPSWHRWSAMRDISLSAANQIGRQHCTPTSCLTAAPPLPRWPWDRLTFAHIPAKAKVDLTWLVSLAPPTWLTAWSDPLMCFFCVQE